MKKHTISEEALRQAADLAAKSMLESLPDQPEYEQMPSDAFRQRMERLLRREEVRHVRRQMLRRMAATAAVVVVCLSVWVGTQPSTWAAASKWIDQVYYQSVLYQSDTPYIEGDVAAYELAWRPARFQYVVRVDGVREDGTGAIRTRAVFYCDVETQDVVVLRYGFLDEAATVLLPVRNKNYTKSKIVMGEKLMDLYTPSADYSDSYLFWMDEESDVYFYIKACVPREEMLHMARTVRPVEAPEAE